MGIGFIMNDVAQIAWETTHSYNLIAKEGEKLW
ncbi:hypothetical protein HDEF_2046 [Candidatus Hamiltonella defensa 5AT (Acyrthosiphon pisum)]|uniref:Uncharacterized protein n=1 Tax=Hamiltonella defensa subsp. Acyrthosiphon pisum (strain 5AT) TaxID=572265 RepID=C4K7S4_HAMD5|nr:hypothetical protein HDEF_2046 [Candidatus Hamiltonella defensa 5AT (Acyrthosiphon pisum)]